jgi:hypothetical protein
MSMETKSLFFWVILILVTFGLWLLRDTRLGFLWKIYKLFWVVLFATLLANYAKDKVKEWWND